MSHPSRMAVAFGGLLASPIGGGLAALAFATETCYSTPRFGEFCHSVPNANAGYLVTIVGWVITAMATMYLPAEN